MRDLNALENYFKAQFIWDKTGKKLQTNLEMEGSKELARNIFVGLATMYGFSKEDICEHLDIGDVTFENRLKTFVDFYTYGLLMQKEGLFSDEATTQQKTVVKTGFVLNAIGFKEKRDQKTKLNFFIDDFNNKS
jgi:hypothetical protein